MKTETEMFQLCDQVRETIFAMLARDIVEWIRK